MIIAVKRMAAAALALALVLAGCVVPQAREDEAAAKAQAAYARCDELRRAGKYPSRVAAVDCAAPTVIAAYREAAYPFDDLIYISIEARRIGAARVDSGAVGAAQYQRDVAELDRRLAAEESRRRGIMKYGGNPQPEELGKLLQGLPSFAADAGAPPEPPPRPGGCTPLGAIKPCQ